MTLSAEADARADQLANLDILAASHLPGRWAVKDSFSTLDLARRGFDVLLEASWMRASLPTEGAASDIAWFTGRRGFRVVAGGMLYRAAGVVGAANVIAEAADAVEVWRSLIVLAAQAFPRLALVGYESGGELAAALDAGFEIGDPLRVWVRSRD